MCVKFRDIPMYKEFQFTENVTIKGTLITSESDGWKPTMVKVGNRSYRLIVGNRSHKIHSINAPCIYPIPAN